LVLFWKWRRRRFLQFWI